MKNHTIVTIWNHQLHLKNWRFNIFNDMIDELTFSQSCFTWFSCNCLHSFNCSIQPSNSFICVLSVIITYRGLLRFQWSYFQVWILRFVRKIMKFQTQLHAFFPTPMTVTQKWPPHELPANDVTKFVIYLIREKNVYKLRPSLAQSSPIFTMQHFFTSWWGYTSCTAGACSNCSM